MNVLLTISPLQAQDAQAKSGDDTVTFNMVVSAAAKTCAPNAAATVTIRPGAQADQMDVTVKDLPPNTDFEFFVIQVPHSPFGVAWYQGEIHTDKHGKGNHQFAGRFSNETFAFAFGSAPAPNVLAGDATVNPPFNPIQMYHLGMWFSSPEAATAATCPGGLTSFGGDHNAGIQILNTTNFQDDHGPLRDVESVDTRN
ncbi:MAG TPA: hypothetical protein VGJ09_03170 [Bryobacteraceae bacterium]